MIKRIMLGLVFGVCFLSLAACQGYREIDSEYLVSAIGFDGGGEEVRIYTEVLEVSSGENIPQSRLFAGTGKTPYEAVESIMRSLPKKAVFDHCGTAIIDSNTSAGAFKEIMKYLYDTKNLNLSICLYCAENAEEILSLKPQGLSIGYDIMGIKNNIEKTGGITLKNKYYEISGLEISQKGFCLPFIAVKDECPEICAVSVYKEFSPVCRLDKNEMVIAALLQYGGSGGELQVSGRRLLYNRISVDKSEENGTARVKMHCEYRSKKHRATNELKTEAERLLLKVRGNPAGNLILPGLSDPHKRVEVKVYGG